MSRIVAQFDPSAQAGSFSAAAVNRCSALLFMNESANFLTLDFGGAFPSTILQPWSNRLIRLAQPVQTVNWTVAATLASTDAPVSQVYVEAFDPSENLDGIASGPLFRQTNVGNAVSTSASTPNSLEQDTLTPFVLGFSSLVATKDGTFPNQLDVTGGVALLRQSDQSIGRVAPVATTFATTALSATYFLDLQPDGTWSFGLAHSGQPNYLPIAQVTTDGSGNIATVTDKRQMNTELLGAMGVNGSALIEMQALGLLAPDLGAGITASIGHLDGTNGAFSNAVFHNTPMSGANPQGYYWASWNGSVTQIPLALGGNFAGAATWIGGLGNIGQVAGQAAAGSFGVPVIVAQVINVAVTAKTLQTILTFTPATNGLYQALLTFTFSNTSASGLEGAVEYTDPNAGTPGIWFLNAANGRPLDGATSYGPSTTTVGCAPVTIYAHGGSAISIVYLDPAGTPADHVSAMLWRLS